MQPVPEPVRATDAEPVLAAEDIVAHRGGRAILTAAALRLHAGTITALAGRNGAGKSTLFDSVVGVRAPTSGRLRVGETTRWRWRHHHTAQLGVCYWPQRGFLSGALTVEAQCELMAARWDTPASDCEQVMDAMPAALRRTRANRISPGERRLAEVALVRLRNPRVVIADEPFTGLSPLASESVAAQLRGLAERGSAVCFSSHEWWLVEAVADAVVYCASGTTRDLGTPHVAREEHAFRREFLAHA
jgi:ABC-type multidrug transport system ATPase subunit